MASEKTQVIEWIFFNRKFDAQTGTLRDALVTGDDIEEGIRQTGARLQTSNPPNFWKDLTRDGVRGLLRNWPTTVSGRGFGGTDAIGLGQRASFRFVSVPPGDVAPGFDFVTFDPGLPVTKLQSLSMPVAMRRLGRASENWHAQVAARLDVVASYFALYSPRNATPQSIDEVNFLQTGIKVGQRAEIDAAFSLISGSDQWLVAAEVKGRTESFYLPQIKRAAIELDTMARSGRSPAFSNAAGIIPLGIKVVKRSVLWVVEFEPVTNPANPLTKVAEGVFELVPHVPGVE